MQQLIAKVRKFNRQIPYILRISYSHSLITLQHLSAFSCPKSAFPYIYISGTIRSCRDLPVELLTEVCPCVSMSPLYSHLVERASPINPSTQKIMSGSMYVQMSQNRTKAEQWPSLMEVFNAYAPSNVSS
jgi:hypothetical protein